MKPDQCVGAGAAKSMADDIETYGERADAWHAVFEAMLRHNPRFAESYEGGLKGVLGELRRLYAIEARAALLLIRGGELPELTGHPERSDG